MEAEMKARVLTVVALFAVVMVFSAAPASAQGIAQQARFQVPFDFSVGDKVLPAGEYTVIGESGEFIRVRSKNGKQTSIALPSWRSGAARRANEVALSFRLYDDQWHLATVWLPDGVGRELLSKRQVEPKMASNVKTVEITARAR
jgi:hypothetical protein